ncbi:hemolysin type calcium-binding protein [Pseudoduganella flava]|uniref:Hemolysin type calcium-binding protein n=1 Tax=Pseudoduganella flava TaxID=871742 RepID=A0A562PSX8_9BURK|nr:calcium-binding protein [Pseudoduganella flava]QGZ39229.1 hypothetical protein GO485_09350 [Pseudoduganella flava]TWI47473.1 hemolysin type calcium-binding protein [Pseudoduganella flava]
MANARTTLAASSQFAALATGVPTEGNDVLSTSDTIDGLGGNDYLTGTTGAQLLIGGSGNDTLEGLLGPDTLVGGNGDDLYLLGPNSGKDIIDNFDTDPNKNDIVYLKGVDASKLTLFQRLGNDLIVKWGTDQSFTLKDAYLGAEHQITALRMYKFLSTSEEVYIPMQALFENYGISLTDADDVLGPSDLSEHISAGAGNDLIDMGSGNDALSGGTGNDTLTGGTGNDILSGDAGNDVLVFRKGDGSDTISATDTTAGHVDMIRFEDVASDGLTAVTYRGGDLILRYGDADEITIKQQFGYANSVITHLQFSDGQTLSMADLYTRYPIHLSDADDKASFTYNMAETVLSGAGNDTVLTFGGDDAVYGEAGNDGLTGGAGNDSLYGGIGNDTLMGENGDDWLDGGAGDDSIVAGLGNDTVVFRSGDGQDILNCADNTAGRVKTLVFEDIAASSLSSLQRVGSNLIVNYTAADKVTISGFFGVNGVFDTVHFADATWSTQDILHNYVIALTTANDNMTFSAFDEIAMGGAGNDSLSGNGGADRLYGEIGNDTLNGGAGADELIGGVGLDSLLGGAGDDQLSGESDSDYLFGEAGNDLLLGGDGNDSVNGGADNDTMYGGAGNDTLAGTAGDDVYVLQLGSGVDTINAIDPTAGRFESLVFEDIQFNQVRSMTKVANNLVIAYGTSDQVTVMSHFAGPSYAINAIQFSDGINHTVDELMAAFSGARIAASATEVVVVGSQLDFAM